MAWVSFNGRDTTLWQLIAGARTQTLANPYGICGTQSCSWTVFYSTSSAFSFHYHSANDSSHSLNYMILSSVTRTK